jgi:hypothetical protein
VRSVEDDGYLRCHRRVTDYLAEIITADVTTGSPTWGACSQILAVFRHWRCRSTQVAWKSKDWAAQAHAIGIAGARQGEMGRRERLSGRGSKEREGTEER